MPRESYRDVHVDRPLTNFSIAHFQDTADYVGHRFFPSISVNFASDEFDFYPSGYFNRIHDSTRAEEGVANSIGYKITKKNYSCGEDALRTFISDRKRANCDSQRRLDQEATMLVTNALLLAKEKAFVESFLKPGIWTTNRVGAANPTGTQFRKWSDAASDPVRDIGNLQVEMLRVGKRKPNKMLMTIDVWNVLRNHPDIMERIRYTGSNTDPAKINLRAVAGLFEVDSIEIMQTVVNNSLEGVEDAQGFPPTNDQFMASNVVLYAFVSGAVGLMAPCAGAQFIHNRYISTGLDGGPAIRRYPGVEGKKGEYIEAEMSMDRRVVAPDLGALLTEVI
jgi:hypothetical protein